MKHRSGECPLLVVHHAALAISPGMTWVYHLTERNWRTQLALISMLPTLMVVTRASCYPQKNSNLNVWAWRPAWSPDGKRLRFDYYQMWEHESKTWEVNPDGSNPHQLLSFSPDRPMYCNSDWTADGKYFVFSSWKDLTSGIPWPASNLWALRERTE